MTIKYNIYELAHKCKEWAILEGYSISSELVKYTNNILDGIAIAKYCGSNEKTIYENTEPEAIFKACQWILDNKDSK